MQAPPAIHGLSAAEAQELRRLVGRLAARLRTRAALRQKKGDGKTLDAKTTLRANLRTGGVPFHLVNFELVALTARSLRCGPWLSSSRPFRAAERRAGPFRLLSGVRWSA